MVISASTQSTVSDNIDNVIKQGWFTEIGSSDFKEFIITGAVLVDKTDLIRAILQSSYKVTLITRPRRWGKTLNLSMLQYFFDPALDNDGNIDTEQQVQKKEIFSKMAIGAQEKIINEYCGKYPVIFVSFKDIKAASIKEMQSKVASLMFDLYFAHKYLLYSSVLDNEDKMVFRRYLSEYVSQPDVEKGIKRLSYMLHKHFKQEVIILIDEYDAPMNDWYIKSLARDVMHNQRENDYLEEVLSLFRGILSSALKDNSCLKKGIVTGVLRIAKASLFSGLNNFTEKTILDEGMAEYFGFTESEVNTLLHESGLEQKEELVESLRNWYNGYKIGDYTIYNPWSIMNMLEQNGNLEAYWMGTADTRLIQNALVLDKFQEEMQTLIEGNTISMIADPKMVFSDIQSSPNALHNLLLFSGYLTATIANKNTDGNSYTCEVRIPNNEVRSIYTNSISAWLQRKLQVTADNYVVFVKYLLSGNIDKFTEKLKSYLEASGSYFDSGEGRAELLYNGFMWGLFASSMDQNYFVEKERETGDGRADMMIIPKINAKYDIAFVLEYKVATKTEELIATANIALEQIKNKNYISKIKSYDNVKSVIGIGLAFCGKHVEVVYEDLVIRF